MEQLARLILSSLDLAEAEARLFKNQLVITLTGIAMRIGLIACAMAMVLGGISLFFWGVFGVVSRWIGPHVTGIVAGLLLLLIALLTVRRASVVTEPKSNS